MNRGPTGLLPFLVALAALATVGAVTSQALRSAGPWKNSGGRTRHLTSDPYTRLDNLLARSRADSTIASTMRDPFGYGPPTVVARTSRSAAKKATPAPVPQPVLTAIVSDANPAAVIRYQDRSYTVKPGDLFAEFRVISVTSDAVVLERGTERLTLASPQRRTKGQ
jgi:hypothetical protein